jgi:hypothetical protein
MTKDKKLQLVNISEWGPPGRRHIVFKDDPEYWQALGRFIEAFASAEIVLFNLTAYYAKMPTQTAKIILSGSRTDACIGHIRKIMEIENFGVDLKNELDDVLAHLAEINTTRNLILHHGSFETNDMGRIASNIARVTPDKIRELRASAEVLSALTTDLYKIGNHLVMLRVRPNASFAERAEQMPILHLPWQYKFSPPEKKHSPPDKRNQRRQPRQRHPPHAKKPSGPP